MEKEDTGGKRRERKQDGGGEAQTAEEQTANRERLGWVSCKAKSNAVRAQWTVLIFAGRKGVRGAKEGSASGAGEGRRKRQRDMPLKASVSAEYFAC
mgnify:CR=1 FL=1